MHVKYKLKEIYSKIFLVTIEDQYDLAMTFCRAQEFYESPFKQIKGKTFTLTEFQKLYAKNFGDGIFTYPRDWAGFNVPGGVIGQLYGSHPETIKDPNEYDEIFRELLNEIKHKIGTDEDYYLIGAEPKDLDTINHEICHALFHLDSDYRKKALSILDKIQKSLFNNFKSQLLMKGYTRAVILDEINAYICFDSGHLTDDIKLNSKQKAHIKFIKYELQKLFNKTISTRAAK